MKVANFNVSSTNFLWFIGIIIALIIWKFSPEMSLPLGIVLSLYIVSIFILSGFINHYRIEANKTNLPRVNFAREQNGDSHSELLCILKPSKLFFHDMLVSFYHRNEMQIEDLIGIGTVINIQDMDLYKLK